MIQDIPVIVVFDSGCGGTTILNNALKKNIGNNYLYFADNLNLPYGPKSKDFVKNRVIEIFSFLNKKFKISAGVIACNTATAFAAESLREIFSFPIVGMEPGIKPAIMKSQTNKVGILATEGTISSSRFTSLIDKVTSQNDLIKVIPGTGLVELIERLPDSRINLIKNLKLKIEELLESKIDVLVLGCTHYLIIQNELINLLPGSVKIIDTTDAVVEVLRSKIKASPEDKKFVNLMISHDAGNYSKKLSKLIECENLKQLDFSMNA